MSFIVVLGRKSIGGLQPFFPTSILNRLNAGDLRKHVKKALDSQSLDIEQEDIKEIQLKYLALVSEFPSLAGGTFHCAVSYSCLLLLSSLLI